MIVLYMTTMLGGKTHIIPNPLIRNTTKEGGRMVKLT